MFAYCWNEEVFFHHIWYYNYILYSNYKLASDEILQWFCTSKWWNTIAIGSLCNYVLYIMRYICNVVQVNYRRLQGFRAGIRNWPTLAVSTSWNHRIPILVVSWSSSNNWTLPSAAGECLAYNSSCDHAPDRLSVIHTVDTSKPSDQHAAVTVHM